MTKKRISGYALLYAVFVMAIVAVFCTSVIMASYYRKQIFIQYEKEFQLQLDVLSGINIYLANNKVFDNSGIQTINLSTDNNERIVCVETKPWGVYSLVTAEAEWKNIKKRKVVLTAYDPIQSENVALYLADHDRALTVCGNTRISGTAYLPETGIERGYIEGQNYLNEKLLYGTRKKSNKSVPDAEDFAKFIQKQMNPTSDEIAKMIVLDYSFLAKDTVIRAFYDSTLILYSESTIRLNKKLLKGNIVVFSKKGIEISKDAKLNDVLLCAPFIKIEKEFAGNIQAIARDSIRVEKECSLRFPSSLSLIDIDLRAGQKQHTFNIGEKCNIEGAVFLYVKNALETTSPPIISIGKETEVKGQIFSNGLIELKGNVQGSVCCESFILTTSSSAYRNALLNSSIEFEKLPKGYGFMDVQMKGGTKKVIKWY
ncbi:MAG: hypothetical protein V2A54_17480 [Bacteroidota bacterium]